MATPNNMMGGNNMAAPSNMMGGGASMGGSGMGGIGMGGFKQESGAGPMGGSMNTGGMGSQMSMGTTRPRPDLKSALEIASHEPCYRSVPLSCKILWVRACQVVLHNYREASLASDRDVQVESVIRLLELPSRVLGYNHDQRGRTNKWAHAAGRWSYWSRTPLGHDQGEWTNK